MQAMDANKCELSAEELFSEFNCACVNVLNTVAPVKTLKSKPRVDPWIDDNIRSLRQSCRRAEHRWKKDKLQVSFEILRDSLLKYQKALRAARSSYFKKFITKNYHRPRTLFTVFNAVINPCV